MDYFRFYDGILGSVCLLVVGWGISEKIFIVRNESDMLYVGIGDFWRIGDVRCVVFVFRDFLEFYVISLLEIE